MTPSGLVSRATTPTATISGMVVPRPVRRAAKSSDRLRADRRNVSEDQDWRLKAELEIENRRSALDRLIGRVREPDVIREVG